MLIKPLLGNVVELWERTNILNQTTGCCSRSLSHFAAKAMSSRWGPQSRGCGGIASLDAKHTRLARKGQTLEAPGSCWVSVQEGGREGGAGGQAQDCTGQCTRRPTGRTSLDPSFKVCPLQSWDLFFQLPLGVWPWAPSCDSSQHGKRDPENTLSVCSGCKGCVAGPGASLRVFCHTHTHTHTHTEQPQPAAWLQRRSTPTVAAPGSWMGCRCPRWAPVNTDNKAGL